MYRSSLLAPVSTLNLLFLTRTLFLRATAQPADLKYLSIYNFPEIYYTDLGLEF